MCEKPDSWIRAYIVEQKAIPNCKKDILARQWIAIANKSKNPTCCNEMWSNWVIKCKVNELLKTHWAKTTRTSPPWCQKRI